MSKDGWDGMLAAAVLEGNAELARELTAKTLAQGTAPEDELDSGLVPVNRDRISESPIDTIRVLEPPELRAGIGVVLELGGEEVYVCAKTDLEREILAANSRPRYTWESGKVTYGPFTTDASLFYARKGSDSLQWAGTHLIGAYYANRELFSAGWNTYTLEPDDWATGFGVGNIELR